MFPKSIALALRPPTLRILTRDVLENRTRSTERSIQQTERLLTRSLLATFETLASFSSDSEVSPRTVMQSFTGKRGGSRLRLIGIVRRDMVEFCLRMMV